MFDDTAKDRSVTEEAGENSGWRLRRDQLLITLGISHETTTKHVAGVAPSLYQRSLDFRATWAPSTIEAWPGAPCE